ncbi:32519_t:CDS:2, partial [Racocetra persica]
DIIFISSKYIVENSEEFVTAAYASIIDSERPEREFDITNNISIASMQTSSNQLSSKTLFTFNNSDIKEDSTFEQKNTLDSDAKNNNKEQQSDHEKENTTISDEYTKSIEDDEEQNNKDQPKKDSKVVELLRNKRKNVVK